MSAWTNVLKPTESSVVVVASDAQPWGLLLAITSVVSADSSSITSGWTGIAKPTSSIWTFISKPTS